MTPGSYLEMSARVQIPFCGFLFARPFVCFAAVQMKSKYPATASRSVRVVHLLKKLCETLAGWQQLAEATAFPPTPESLTRATGVRCSVEVQLSPLIPFLLFDNPFTACFAAFFAVILLPE